MRARFPVLDGRLVPYVVTGLGASYTDFNDTRIVKFASARPGYVNRWQALCRAFLV